MAFKNAADSLPPKKQSYAKMLGTGITSAIKVPWKLTKVVVYSLEKVKH